MQKWSKPKKVPAEMICGGRPDTHRRAEKSALRLSLAVKHKIEQK